MCPLSFSHKILRLYDIVILSTSKHLHSFDADKVKKTFNDLTHGKSARLHCRISSCRNKCAAHFPTAATFIRAKEHLRW